MKLGNLRSILLDPDVNDTAGGPSATETNAGGQSSAQTAADAATTETGVKQEPQTLSAATDKIIADVLAKHKQDSPPAKEEKAAESPGQQKTETEEEAPVKEDTEASQTEQKTQEAIPYERFKEVNDKNIEFEAKVKELEPLAESQRSIINFCQENNISGEDFQKTLEIARLIQVDPAAALKEIEPIYNALKGLTGEVLPADLKQAVDDGVLPEAYAKELAKARGGRQFSDLQNRNTQQRLQQDQNRQFVTSIQTSIKTWADTKVLSDPDFKPKAGPNAADGKFEVFSDRLFKLMTAEPPKNVADAVKLAERAYEEVGKMFSNLKPKPAPSKSVSSTKSTTNNSTSDKAPFVEGGMVPSSIINSVLGKYQSRK